MEQRITIPNIISCLFATLVFTAGIANIFLIHPVPGVAYLLLSLVYLPPVDYMLKRRFGFSILPIVKIILGIVIILFTFGVSDLGDVIDKW